MQHVSAEHANIIGPKTHKLLHKLRATISHHPCTRLGSKLYKNVIKMHKPTFLVKNYLKFNQCDKIRTFKNNINIININPYLANVENMVRS